MPQIVYYFFQLTASLVERILDDEAETFNCLKIKKQQQPISVAQKQTNL